MAIKAIETRYNGRRFRSRAEARHAVFFDNMGIAYEYEKEGFVINSKPYLPDFYLPELDLWYEVKGAPPTEEEIILARDFAVENETSIGLAYGEVWQSSSLSGIYRFDNFGIGDEDLKHLLEFSSHYQWICCYACGYIDLLRHGYVYTGNCTCRDALVWINDPQTGIPCQHTAVYPPSSRIFKAYAAAGEARFEFGETPKPPKKGRRA